MRVAPLVVAALGSVACHAPASTESGPTEVAAVAEAAPPPAIPERSRLAIPSPDAAPQAPTHEPPPGPPGGPGAIRQILAIDDDHAVVVFTPFTAAGVSPPTLAGMRGDGSIEWSVTLGGMPLVGRTTTGIERVGDAVSVAIGHSGDLHDRLDRIEIYGARDGRLRKTVRPRREAYARDTVVDRGVRFDTTVAVDGSPSELIATDAKGERWRASLDGNPAPEIVALPDHVALPLRGDGDGQAWHVFDRAHGKLVATVTGGDTCSDGRRWFVRQSNALVEVELPSFTTRLVIDAEKIERRTVPGPRGFFSGDEWYARDCAIVDGEPVLFGQLGMIEAFVTADAEPRIQPLGIRRYREGAVDPLPDVFHPVVVLGGHDVSDAYDMIVADMRKADAVGASRPATHVGVGGILRFDEAGRRGYVVATRDVVGVVDGDTGEIVGHHIRRDTMGLHRTALVGTRLWLPPAAGTKLGRAAPTVLDLATPPARAEIRDALATSLGGDRRGEPAHSCDGVVHGAYDGVETSAGLGPVAPSREPPWDADNLAVAARRYACASASAIVTPLGWAVLEDHRPLRNHYALIMVEDVVDGAPQYTVVDMYRHATNLDWNVSTSFHDPSSFARRWMARPTSAELDAFIDQASFPLADDWGRLLAGNVLDSSWLVVTGEPPLRHMPAGIEQVD